MFASRLPKIVADSTQLHLVFTNIVLKEVEAKSPHLL